MSERTAIYLHDWSESGEAGMLDDFDVAVEALAGATVIVASYTYEDYSGSAYVLFERDSKLFEVHGSHCSCYGLEGQWEPEEADREAIIQRLSGTWYDDEAGVKEAISVALKVAA